LESNIASAFEIYSNGVKIMQAGAVAPYSPTFTDFPPYLIVSIPDGQVATGSIVLALRAYVNRREWAGAQPGFYFTNLYIGQQSVIEDQRWLRIIGLHTGIWIMLLLRAVLALCGFLLYYAQRRREYLYLFLWNLCGASSLPYMLYCHFHSISWWWGVLLGLLDLPWIILFVYTYMAFVDQRVGWRLRLFTVFASLMSFLSEFGFNGFFSGGFLLASYLPSEIIISIVLPVFLIVRMRRGNRDAGLLLIPLILWGLADDVDMILTGLQLIPALRRWGFGVEVAMQSLHAGPFVILPDVLGQILSSFSLMLVILLRSNRVSQQKAQLDSELDNARQVQQVILPDATESVPGFHVESAYEPAQQVGGDFFQTLPDGKGGLLLVLGDVAGKGLPAAMLVSVLVGAIRTAANYTSDPAEILAQLNERLLGRTHGGFAIGVVAHIAADGMVSIANAGHLSPYLDGREIELPGALPLGIVAGARYETRRFQLAAGSRLTFYSDGVVEAQNASGELLGFERAEELSTRPASEIAQTAKSFGQSDDITVVAIERAATLANAA
jgi:phosphoserine phosphatase RsbU/P